MKPEFLDPASCLSSWFLAAWFRAELLVEKQPESSQNFLVLFWQFGIMLFCVLLMFETQILFSKELLVPRIA